MLLRQLQLRARRSETRPSQPRGRGMGDDARAGHCLCAGRGQFGLIATVCGTVTSTRDDYVPNLWEPLS